MTQPTPKSDLRRVQTVCLLILTAICLGVALHWLRDVTLPFVLALFITIGLQPLIRLLRRRLRVPYLLAALAAVLLAAALLMGVAWLMSASLGQLLYRADEYARQVEQTVAPLQDRLQRLMPGDPNAVPETQPILSNPGQWVGSVLRATAGGVLSVTSNGMMVFIFLIFLLFGSTPSDTPARGLWGEIVPAVEAYLLIKTGVSAATGLLTGLALGVLGVNMAVVFGLLAFLLNFIPSIGSFIAIVLPLPIILADPDSGWGVFVAALILLSAIQFVLGNILDPRLTGKSCRLHPIVALLALMFWGVIWGIVGMVLAVPITAAIKIILQKSDLTAPAARLLGGDVRAITEEPAPGADA
jgi:AI-2 transport protein TqsA